MSTLRKYHIPLAGAILVLLAFFLPWLSVGCDELLTVDVSGYDLAKGTLFSEAPGLFGAVEEMPFDPGLFRALWLVPAVAVIALALVLVTWRRPEMEARTGLGHVVAGLLGFAGLLFVWLQTRDIGEGADAVGELANIGELVQMKYGVWLTVAALLIIIVGGVLSYMEARSGQAGRAQLDYGGYTQTSTSGAGAGYGGATIDSGEANAYQPPASSYTAPVTLNEPPPAPPRHATEVLDRRDPLAMAWLVMKDGPRAGHTFRLLETTSIGRDAGNDVIIDDASLSGQHAKVKFEDGDHYVIYDLASTNGLFYYDETKQEWVRDYRIDLRDGQQVKLGRTVLHFMAPKVDKSA